MAVALISTRSQNRYEEYICIFKRLRLTPYLFKRMYREFTKADKDNSGALSIEEFFGAFELTFVTPLAKRAFYAFDLDGSGELDYGEFTVSNIYRQQQQQEQQQEQQRQRQQQQTAHPIPNPRSIPPIPQTHTYTKGIYMELLEHNNGRPRGILF